ncbi:BlaB/IND/MUS family subclass B1 metallo-beta-lactamase [Pedobacter africanus]|uniref:beta-lactamase n=1 Tax=Pedobacter africanus TaxID=151894 RepID=A0A1W2ADL2_9SPHI|nr:BlaB/IND/MUS family subclass B1 metallo-beta-lactamase [Pedobacter africanus]SMC58683.1 Glyoxylase, beta-lactamase superfamily II [Pedobacter africanus]
MRISLLTCLLLLFLVFSVYAQKLEIIPVNKRLCVYTTYHSYKGETVSANALYLITRKGVVLFDTPWDQTQNQPLLDSIEKKHRLKVIMVFATHSHEDRAGGFGFFNRKGIPTYASEQTNAILKAENKPLASNAFKKGAKFDIGGEKFQLDYFGAGHTKDNLVVWFPEYKVLDGGCLIKSAAVTDLGFVGDADLTAWPKTILAIKNNYKMIRLVVAGHDSWQAPGALDHTLELLKKNNL